MPAKLDNVEQFSHFVKATSLCKTICIVGICKNAGKTTVLNCLLSHYDGERGGIAVTSIGRDGEKTDLVTNTPKPEIFVKEGTVCATAEKLLPFCSTTKKILATTDFATPLGRVVVFQAESDGFVQLAGPSIIEQVDKCRQLLFSLGAKCVIVDGAISRLSSCRLCGEGDGIILCSGASFSPNMEHTVAQTQFIEHLLTLKSPQKEVNEAIKSAKAYIDEDGKGTSGLKQKQFLSRNDGKQHGEGQLNDEVTNCIILNDKLVSTYCSFRQAVQEDSQSAKYIYIDGVFGQKEAKMCLGAPLRQREKVFLLPYGQNIQVDYKKFGYLTASKIDFAVLNQSPLYTVAANPFSARGSEYPPRLFREKLSECLKTFVIDVCDRADK